MFSRRFPLWTAFLLLAVLAVQIPQDPATATHPGTNGKLAVVVNPDSGESDIWIMDTDGSEAVNLTSSPSIPETDPAWSPDGRYLAYTVFGDPNVFIRIWDSETDTTQDLAPVPGHDVLDPTWSPDGQRLAFEVTDNVSGYDIWSADVDGTNAFNITQAADEEWPLNTNRDPDWSPDGTKIAFTGFEHHSDIFVINVDGTGRTNLTALTLGDYRPSWSPDGGHIVFESQRHALAEPTKNYDLYVMASSGSGVTRLTNDTNADTRAAWSPDGTKIAYVSQVDNDPGTPQALGSMKVYVVDADGSNAELVYGIGDGYVFDPAWGHIDTEPLAPGQPAVTAGDEQVTVGWAAPYDGGSPITHYDVEVEDLTAGGSLVTDVGVVLSAVVSDLENGHTHRARVRAANAVGDGEWSPWSANFVPCAVPSSPGSPDVTASDEQVSASWTAPDDNGGYPITNYELQVNDETAATHTYIDAGVALSRNIDGLTNGHSYRLRVRAENVVGAGSWSGWSASVVPKTVPSAPLNPTVNVTGVDAATASWSPPADDGGASVTGYELLLENRSIGGSASFYPGSVTSYGLVSLSVGNTYRYRVRAENCEGWGPWSVWSADFVPGTVPAAPDAPTVTGGDASIAASWDPPDDDGGLPVTNYRLELNDETASSTTYLDVGTTLTKAVYGLSNGHIYRLRVRAENAIGPSNWSEWSSSVTPATFPGAPVDPMVTVTATDTAVATWSPADDGGIALIGYELALENRSSGAVENHDVGLVTTYSLSGLLPGDFYRFRVRASNAIGSGSWSVWSSDFAVQSVPSAPGVPQVTAGDAEIVATWAAASGYGSTVDNYEVELDNITMGSATTADTVAFTYTFTGVMNGDQHRVRVRAHNTHGWGPWSGWSETVIPHAPPDTFGDDDGTVFEADVEWLAAQGITRGCNPPTNDRFCPGDPVTRGQMAAFLHRALVDVLTAGAAVEFVDDDGSVFEADIEWLGSVGVTRGCNPPDNDMFCPDAVVTRGQMAAFLSRALELPAAGDAIVFVDSDGSIFEDDIERLAAAGITRGCNPPDNDMFCPDAVVTRGQMAAFLHRALS